MMTTTPPFRFVASAGWTSDRFGDHRSSWSCSAAPRGTGMELTASDATGQFRELFALAPTWIARAQKVDGSARSGRRRWVVRRQLDQGRTSPPGAIADRV